MFWFDILREEGIIEGLLLVNGVLFSHITVFEISSMKLAVSTHVLVAILPNMGFT